MRRRNSRGIGGSGGDGRRMIWEFIRKQRWKLGPAQKFPKDQSCIPQLLHLLPKPGGQHYPEATLCVCFSFTGTFQLIGLAAVLPPGWRSGSPPVTDNSSHPWSKKTGVQELEKVYILVILWRRILVRGCEGRIGQDFNTRREFYGYNFRKQ